MAMNTFNDFAANTNNWVGAFQASPTWPYTTPAHMYFWAGFCFVFALGLFMLAIGWAKRSVGDGIGLQ